MRIFNKFQTQEFESESEQAIRAREMQEHFDLKEPVDEDSLEAFWDAVEEDIQKDPDWFKFS